MKLIEVLHAALPPLGYPRLNSRGPIEAVCRETITFLTVHAYPRLNSRSPIEAAPNERSRGHNQHYPRLNSRGTAGLLPLMREMWVLAGSSGQP